MAADARRAAAAYAALAGRYDARLGLGRLLHRRAVDALDPRPGDTVLDVACGTGLALAPLRERVGEHGRIVGIDVSEAMLERARRRVAENGSDNVTLLHGRAEELELATPADAALLVLAHDVTTSRPALEAVLAALTPGGRIVAAGAKWAPRWAPAVNAYVWLKARRYVTTFEHFDRPWRVLESLLRDVHARPVLGGAAYVAVAHAAAGRR